MIHDSVNIYTIIISTLIGGWLEVILELNDPLRLYFLY